MKLPYRNLFFLAFFLFHLLAFIPKEGQTLPTEFEPLRLYSLEQGDRLQDLVIQGINGAKTSLNIATYTLSDPKVIKAIKEASDRGVDVVVAVDKNGYHGRREALGEKTRWVQRGIKGLMHQKWIIQDEFLTLIGSANLTWDSLNRQNNLIVAIASKAFAQDLLSEANKKTVTSIDPQGVSWTTLIPPFSLKCWTTPKNPALKGALLEALDTAQKTVRIALYTFTEKELLEKVVDAKKRGVDVVVALDKGQALGSCYETFLRLMKESIPVGLSVGKPLLHHKFVWIDEDTFFTGSFNWTKAALHKNEELLIHFSGGHQDDPFWKALKVTWKELSSFVEWQKKEDWSDPAKEKGGTGHPPLAA